MHPTQTDAENKNQATWENDLKEYTKERNPREFLFDPFLIEQTCIDEKGLELIDALANSEWEQERNRQIDLVKRIARRKLKGLTRYCFLLMLLAGAGPKRIAQILGLPQDAIERAIKRGTKIVQGCLAAELGEFPASQGKRPPLRASLFPLDTPKEREEFQRFLNEHTVVHVSFRGEDMFREVLVIYLTGKSARKSP